MTKFIGGPIALYHYYSDYYGMEIYLFADYHSIHSSCGDDSIMIGNYLSSFFSNNHSIPIDIYLESATLIDNRVEKTPNLDQHRSYIQDVVKVVEPCIIPLKVEGEKSSREGAKGGHYDGQDGHVRGSKGHKGSNYDGQPHKSNGHKSKFSAKKCPYQHLRVHALDFRSDNPINIWFYFLAIYEGRQIDDSPEIVTNHCKFVLKRLKDIVKKYPHIHLIDMIVKLYDIGHIMENQYKRVNDKLREKIMNYLDKQLEKLVPNGTRAVIKGLEKFIADYGKADPTELADDLYPYIEGETWLLDYYGFAKMFSTMNINDSAALRPSNLLYYAGYYHIDSTLRLLKKLGFKMIEEYQSAGKKQCVNLSYFKQPFFSLTDENRCEMILDSGKKCENEKIDQYYCKFHIHKLDYSY